MINDCIPHWFNVSDLSGQDLVAEGDVWFMFRI